MTNTIHARIGPKETVQTERIKKSVRESEILTRKRTEINIALKVDGTNVHYSKLNCRIAQTQIS
jgi:hypothetical protein